MIRFLSFLFNKPYEPCKSCETLKQQLEFERSEKKELLDTILRIVNPKVVEAPAVEMTPVNVTTGSFTRRRAILEQKDREEARIKKQSPFLASEDKVTIAGNTSITATSDIDKLEKELGIEETEKAN